MGRIPARLWSAALSAAFVFSTGAFVVDRDANGYSRRWNINNSSAPTNSFNRWTSSVRFYLPVQTANQGLEEQERNCIRASFGQWQSINGLRIRFEEAGLVENPDTNTEDATNVVFFAKTQFINGGRDSILNRGLGVTYFKTGANNELLEADIALNDFQYDWEADITKVAAPKYFIEATMLHEIGHLLGLDHSPAGGATMFTRSVAGLNPQAGLSNDDYAARGLYFGLLPGEISGTVTANGQPVFGAVVSAIYSGSLLQSTVTGADGSYSFSGFGPAAHEVRVTPLDPSGGSSLTRLVSGVDISPAYVGAKIDFLPSTQLTTNSLHSIHNFAVSNGAPAFRITRIIPPAADPQNFTAQNAPIQVVPGTTGVFVGVAGPALPTADAILEIPNGFITVGTTRFLPDHFGTTPPLRTLYASISVHPNATPGLFSFIVRSGENIAYANGFLEILPASRDDNFDGLDDLFQRKHFPVFTSPEAAPAADPDSDGASNRNEYFAATIPTNGASSLKLDEIIYSEAGARIRWQSVPGKRYRIWTRDLLGNSPWLEVGPVVTATGSTSEQTDPTASSERYYRVEVFP